MSDWAKTLDCSNRFAYTPIVTGLIVSFTLFAVIHSITAAQSFKDWIARLMGERAYQGFYRLIYSAVSAMTLIPIAYFYLQLPNRSLYTVPAPWAWFLFGLQAAGLIGLTISVLQSGAMAFVGVSQALDYLAGKEIGRESGLGETLVTHGLYRYMRHPLYTFSLLLLWPNPWMTRNYLILTVLITVYFVLGSFIEERRLEGDFGEAYADYKKGVARFIPFIW